MTVDIYNTLLYWISERGKLATQTVRSACNIWHDQLLEQHAIEKVDKPFYTWMDGLRRSGHVEFNSRGCFSVPPVFVIRHESESEIDGFFCGRRDNALWETLEAKHSKGLQAQSQSAGADRWSYRGEKRNFLNVLKELNIPWQESPSDTLLKRLPPLQTALKAWCHEDLRSMTDLKWVYTNNQWEPIGDPEADQVKPGLFKNDDDRYCFKPEAHSAAYLLKIGEPLQLARWWINVREKHVTLYWSDEEKTLTIKPNALKLPMMLDRLLRLRSGLAPDWNEGGHWSYREMPHGVALEVARIINVRLEEPCAVH